MFFLTEKQPDPLYGPSTSYSSVTNEDISAKGKIIIFNITYNQ